MASTREIIESALRRGLTDAKGSTVTVRLLPSLSAQDLDALARSLPVPLPDEIHELLKFSSGIEGMLHQIDFSGRSLQEGFGAQFLPYGFPIAKDVCGNYWVVDLQPGKTDWGPIYFCCHDAPILLLQAETVRQFVHELLKMYTPPHQSLVEDVHEDRLFNIWTKNPGVISHADAIASRDGEIRRFAASLEADFDIIDLREAPVGMGFSWGRYGWQTEVKRLAPMPIFAYRKAKSKKGLLSRIFAR